MDTTNTSFCLYSDIKSITVDWLWYPYIPFGKITLLQGDPGGGKSTMMMDLIGKITTSRMLPDGRTINPINVIYQCSEDGLADTIKPRLEKAGADCTRIGYITEDIFGLSLDDEIIRNAIIDMKAKLLVVDPFQAYLGDTDLSSAIGMRRLLRRLSMWATATDCAIILVGHLNKKNGSNDLYRGLGSIDLTAAARSVIQVEKDTYNDEIRTVKHIKSSLAPRGSDSYFIIDDFGRVKWGEFDRIDSKDKIEDQTIERPPTKQEIAVNLIKEILAQGPMEAVIVNNILQKTGIGERTIKIAKKMIAVASFKKNGKWYWILPTFESDDNE